MTAEPKSTRDVYSIVTENIINFLEMGIMPWRHSWVKAGIPRNAITQKPYRGINVLLLAMQGYTQNLFITEEQLANLGGTVKKGQYYHIATYWEWKESTNGSSDKWAALKYSKVFNISQCEGVELTTEGDSKPENPLLICKQIVQNMPNAPKRETNKQSAWYAPIQDVVHMPASNEYTKPEYYYYDLFKLLAYATGNPSRLNRTEQAESEPVFSKETLIADIAAHYLCFYAGISENVCIPNAKHIYGWIERFTDDPKFIVSAATQAQKAVDYILNLKPTQESDNDNQECANEK